jgi:hypothetical protein
MSEDLVWVVVLGLGLVLFLARARSIWRNGKRRY